MKNNAAVTSILNKYKILSAKIIRGRDDKSTRYKNPSDSKRKEAVKISGP